MKAIARLVPLLGGVVFAWPSVAEEPPPVALKLPVGYVIAPGSTSPNGRYGVSSFESRTYPLDLEKVDEPNRLINLRTGEAFGALRAQAADTHMNHGGILPCRWSADGSLLLWEVSGKWCPWALNLVRLSEDRIVWQTNLLLDAQRAILERTRQANPRGYRAAMKENKAGKDNRLGSGTSVYPDGFTVDVSTNALDGQPLILPLKVTASLTADHKHLIPWPAEANVNALLEATVVEGGRLRVTSFRTAKRPFPPF